MEFNTTTEFQCCSLKILGSNAVHSHTLQTPEFAAASLVSLRIWRSSDLYAQTRHMNSLGQAQQEAMKTCYGIKPSGQEPLVPSNILQPAVSSSAFHRRKKKSCAV